MAYMRIYYNGGFFNGQLCFDNSNGLWYKLIGDYYIPYLTLPAEEEKPIGVYGRRHLRYLKEYRRATYTNLLTSGRLNDYLADIDERVKDMLLSDGKGMCR